MDAFYEVNNLLNVPFAMKIIIIAAWDYGSSEIIESSRIKYQLFKFGRPFSRMNLP
jgi:hypothetical protein